MALNDDTASNVGKLNMSIENVEWFWQETKEVIGERYVPVSLCPPEIPHGERALAFALAGRQQTTCLIVSSM